MIESLIVRVWRTMPAAFLAVFLIVTVATSGRCLTTGKLVIDRGNGKNMNMETSFTMTDRVWLNTDRKNDDSFECDEFDAVDLERTSQYLLSCKCTEDASTFSHSDGEWTCVENEEFRDLGKCRFLFEMEREDDPIRILQDGEEKAILLPHENCSIDASTSEYLDCGTWRPIDDMRALNKLSLHRGSADSYSLKVGSSNFSTFLNGRVIKLALTCLPPVGKSCLLFKLRGSERCSFFVTHSTPTQAAHTSAFKPSETHDHLLPVEFNYYAPTRSVSPTSIVSTVVQKKPSFKPSQTIPLSTIPPLEEVAPLFVNGMSLITSFRKTVPSPKLTSHVADSSSSIPFVNERVESRQMISNSKTETFNLISAPKSTLNAGGSIKMNGRSSRRGKGKKKSTLVSRGRTSDSIVLTVAIPGTLAGLLVILVSILLLFLTRRMGHLVRVAAEREENAEEVQPSISEDHTIHGSEENLSVENFSVYELAEMVNSSSVTENQASVESCN